MVEIEDGKAEGNKMGEYVKGSRLGKSNFFQI